MSDTTPAPAASPFSALGKPPAATTPPATEAQDATASEEAEPTAPMAVYTSGSIANLTMGDYTFADGQMVIDESQVDAFEAFLMTQPPGVVNGIKRVTTLTIHAAPAMIAGVASTDSMQPAPAA